MPSKCHLAQAVADVAAIHKYCHHNQPRSYVSCVSTNPNTTSNGMFIALCVGAAVLALVLLYSVLGLCGRCYKGEGKEEGKEEEGKGMLVMGR